LIGYSFFIAQYSLHYKHKILAVNDLFYVLPEHRCKFLGIKLIKESEKILQELGINQVHMRTKTYADFGSILKRAGYQAIEIAYRKDLTLLGESDNNNNQQGE
jgi:hypothetical protein